MVIVVRTSGTGPRAHAIVMPRAAIAITLRKPESLPSRQHATPKSRARRLAACRGFGAGTRYNNPSVDFGGRTRKYLPPSHLPGEAHAASAPRCDLSCTGRPGRISRRDGA